MHTEKNSPAPDLGDVLERGFWCCRTTTNNDREPLMQQMFIFNVKIFWQRRRYLVTRYSCGPSIYFSHLHMNFSKYLLNQIRDFPEQHSFYLCSLLSRSVGDQPSSLFAACSSCLLAAPSDKLCFCHECGELQLITVTPQRRGGHTSDHFLFLPLGEYGLLIFSLACS